MQPANQVETPFDKKEVGVGVAIRYLRLKKNLSQRQLAIKAGLVHCQINDYERCESLPSIISMSKIIEALGIDNLTFSLLTLKAMKNQLNELDDLEPVINFSRQTQENFFNLSPN